MCVWETRGEHPGHNSYLNQAGWLSSAWILFVAGKVQEGEIALRAAPFPRARCWGVSSGGEMGAGRSTVLLPVCLRCQLIPEMCTGGISPCHDKDRRNLRQQQPNAFLMPSASLRAAQEHSAPSPQEVWGRGLLPGGAGWERRGSRGQQRPPCRGKMQTRASREAGSEQGKDCKVFALWAIDKSTALSAVGREAKKADAGVSAQR